MIHLPASIHSGTNDVYTNSFAYDHTTRVLTYRSGATTATVTLNANAGLNIVRQLRDASDSGLFSLSDVVPVVNLFREIIEIPSGSTWFDLPASPDRTATYSVTNLLIPFFINTDVISTAPAQTPAIMTWLTGGAANFGNFIGYTTANYTTVPTVVANVTAFQSVRRGGATGGGAGTENQIRNFPDVPAANTIVNIRTSDSAVHQMTHQSDTFLNLNASDGAFIRAAVTPRPSGQAVSALTESSYIYQNDRYTGDMTWDGSVWVPTSTTDLF